MKKLIILFALIPFFAFAQIGCTDSDATNYNSNAFVDDGSCYLDVYENNPNQNILYTHDYHGYFRIDKYITDNGGFRVHIKAAMGENQQNDASYAVKSIGDILHHNPSVGDFQVLNFDDSSPIGGVANVGFANGMHVDLHGNYSTNKMHQPSYANNSGDWSYWYSVGSAGYTNEFVEFDWQPSDYNLFFNSTVGFVLNNRSFRIYNSTFNGDSHIDKSFNMEPIQSDYGSITTPLIPTGSITITDNGITISNSAVFGSSSGYARVTKAVKRLSNGTYAFDDIDGDAQNDLYKISPSNNTYTFEVGPLQDGVFGDYEIWIGDINYNSSALRKYKIDNIQTLPYQNPNILAENVDDNVRVSWTKNSSIPTSELIYYVERGELSADGDSIVWDEDGYYDEAPTEAYRYRYDGSTNTYWNATNGASNLPADEEHTEFSYIDYTADPNKTYMYRIHTFGASDNVYYAGLDQGHTSEISTGAGTDFFNNTQFNLSATGGYTSICDGFAVAGSQVNVNSIEYALVDESLSFAVGTDYAQSQTLLIYTDSACTIEYVDDSYPYGGITDLSFSNLEIVNTTGHKVYVKIKARRSDDKVFESFYPLILEGAPITAPSKPIIEESLSSFDNFNNIYFSIHDYELIDELTIKRLNNNTEGLDSISINLSELNLIDESYYLFVDNYNNLGFSTPTEVCIPYTYSIRTSNCGYQDSEVSDSITLTPSITKEVFTETEYLSVSQGDFGDRVFLSWDNNNTVIISSYTIQRKQLDDTSSNWVNLATLPNGSKSFTDLYASSNILYKYKVTAIIPGCSTTNNSNGYSSKEVVGFRRPTARVLGTVSYESFDPVENVYVHAEPNYFAGQESFNQSLQLANTALEIPNFKTNVHSSENKTSFTLNFWYHKGGVENGNIFSITSSQTNGLYMNLSPNKFSIFTASEITDNTAPVLESIADYCLDEWAYISLVYNDLLTSPTLELFVNGVSTVLKDNFTLSEFSVNDHTQLFFGHMPYDLINSYSSATNGNIDEISLFNRALTVDEIDYNKKRFITNVNNDLAVYYPCDEGYGNVLYDFSSNTTNIFNKNHINILNASMDSSAVATLSTHDETTNLFSDNVTSSIGFLGITDASGYYDIDNIRYVGTGSNFSITPVTLTEDYDVSHVFEPNTLNTFIGDGQVLITSINFTDKTAVQVSGSVLFDVENLIDMGSTQIGVEGVTVFLNGEEAQTDNGVLKTDEVGNFSLSVPIGYQCISFEKDGYSFVNNNDALLNRYCENFSFDMETDLGDFACNTYKELRGRVTGGLTYEGVLMDSIAIGFDNPANTVGQVGFTLSQKDKDNNHSISILTDTTSGEFYAKVLPIEYSVTKSSFKASNALVETAFTQESYLFESIDMSVQGENSSEGVFVEELISSEQNESIITFHNRYDLTYRTSPSVSVSQINGTDTTSFLGEELYDLDGLQFDLKDETAINAAQYVLGNPVFKQLFGGITYQFLIEVRESYENFGMLVDPASHSENQYLSTAASPYYHPLNEGELSIQNEMLENPEASIEVDGSEILYSFAPNNPHVFGKDESYFRSFVVDYQNGTTTANLTQDAFLFGVKSYGNDFFTFGPDAVDMILRDPPGDASYSWIEEGTTVTRTQRVNAVNGRAAKHEFNWNVGVDGKIKKGVSVGTGFFNVTIADEITYNALLLGTLENSVSSYKSNENEISISETFSETISTSGEDFSIGSIGDVFIGESKNLNFGTSKKLHFIKSAYCGDTEGIYECYEGSSIESEDSSDTYKVGTITLPSISPGTNTKFAYSGHYIESYLLPKLYFIRNSYLIGEYNVFEGKTDQEILAMTSHPCWGEAAYSNCFDENNDNTYLEPGYYSVSTTEETFNLPVLTDYSNSQIVNILGSSLESFQNGFTTATTNNSGTNYNQLLTYSIGSGDITEFVNSVNTSASFSVGNYSSTSDINNFVREFKNNHDFTDAPGILNIDNVISNLTDADELESINIIIPDDLVYFYNQQIKLWKTALAQNELDKFQSTFRTNHSISAGVEIESVHTTSGTYNQTRTIGYQLEHLESIGLSAGASMSSFSSEMDFLNSGIINFEFESSTILEGEASRSIGYFLKDDEHGDVFSVDVRDSKYGFGPIFKTLAGVSMCPFEDATMAKYINNTDDYYIKDAFWHFDYNELVENQATDGVLSVYKKPFYYSSLETVVNNISTTSIDGENIIANTDFGSPNTSEVNDFFDSTDNYDDISNEDPWTDFSNTDILIIQKIINTDFNGSNEVILETINDIIFEFSTPTTSYKTIISGKTTSADLLLLSNKLFPISGIETDDDVFEVDMIATYGFGDGTFRSIADRAFLLQKTYTEVVSTLTDFELSRKAYYSLIFEAIEEKIDALGLTDEVELSATTSRREKPTLGIYPYNQYNVPEQEAAVFTITLGNESESGDPMPYMLRVDEITNPDGAIIEIDGLSPNRMFLVPAGSTVTKTVTVKKGPKALNYEGLGFILHSPCQYDFGGLTIPDIADSIYFNAYFLPTCTDIAIDDLDDDWLVNTSDNSTVNLKIKDYDVNYYSLETIDLEYKYENDDWQKMESLESPLAVVNSESYKYMDALNLYNLLHSDFESLVSTDTLRILNWYNLIEPNEKCDASCTFLDLQGIANYTANNLSDDEYIADNWLDWKYTNTDSTCTFKDGQTTYTDGLSTSISCYTSRSLEEKLDYLSVEMNRLKEEHLGSDTLYSNDVFLSMRNLSSTYSWSMPSLPSDGQYKIRAKSDCGTFTPHTGGDPQDVIVYSPIYDLYSDRIQPEVFGNIQPVDGILNPDDEILLTFNEAINQFDFNVSTAETFVEVKAKRNGTEHHFNSYMYFDGTGEMTIPAGVQLDGAFTIEMWIKPESNGVLFEQSYGDNSDGFILSLENLDEESNSVDLKMIYTHPSAEDVTESHTISLSSVTFTHIAFSYDDAGNLNFYYNTPFGYTGVNFDFTGRGPITIGSGYQGAILDLRLWNTNRTSSDIAAYKQVSLSGREANLIGYWPMGELYGDPQDKSRYRHAITTAQWTVESENLSKVFNGTDSLFIEPISVGITATGDYTVEAWFKSENTSHQTLFSIGNWAFPDAQGAWSFDLNEGNVEVYQSGANASQASVSSSGVNYSDNQWHHLAFVKSDIGNTRLYIDGGEVAEGNSADFAGISAINLNLGYRSPSSYLQEVDGSYLITKPGFDIATYVDGTTSYQAQDDITIVHTTVINYTISGEVLTEEILVTSSDSGSDIVSLTSVDYTNTTDSVVWSIAQEQLFTDNQNLYTGKLDEVRIWNLAKTTSQIKTDANNALSGAEIGLNAYLNFDTDTVSVSLTDVPLIMEASVKTSVSFDDVSNGDQVFINITEAFAKVENTMLNITVQNVEDLNGNTIEEPITWDVYVDKNQLIWDEQLIEKEKFIGESLVFETHIVNQGGTVETFEISNLPNWLTAIPSEGLLEPNSFMQIELVVNEELFIGDYQEDLMLIGNNEYAERLELHLEVEAPTPTYDFDATDFLYTMSFVGMVKVEGVRSRDEKDILFAYVGDEVRGATELIYLEDYDAYFVFFSVYSNTATGENVNFRLWDASEGKIQSQIELTSSIYPITSPLNEVSTVPFLQGAVVGSFADLTHFAASNMLRQEIPLNEGWNWVSFNLDAEDDTVSNNLLKETVLSNVQNSTIEVVKNQMVFAQSFEESIFGTLTSFDIESLYMFKMADGAEETLIYEGKAIDPALAPITINSGWNWIGYLGQRMLSTNEALSSLNPSPGDLIKSQTAFSMYASESLGWLGTLTNMQGGKGYMMKTTESGELIYPQSSMYGGGSLRVDMNHYAADFWEVDAGKYENSMSIVARIDHPDYMQPNSENLLGAFAGLDCVGNISATELNEEESIYFITVYGEDDSKIHFDYYDVAKQKIYRTDNILEFTANKLVGSVENPYPISIEVETQDLEVFFDLTVYPNPFADVFDLAFSLEENAEVEIQIFDVMGRFVKTVSKGDLESGAHKLQIDGEDLSKGVYFIEIIIGEDSYKKMIVKS